MFTLRTLTRSSRRLPLSLTATRAGATRAPALARSFWDQKDPEKKHENPTDAANFTTSARMSDPPRFGTNDYLEPEGWIIAPYLAGLLTVGAGLAAYGIYGLYKMMTMWPKEIRQDLRSGLRAKRKGDWDIALQYITRAWNEARDMPRETFGPQALLKVSGIGIALASTAEEAGQYERAFHLYEDVLRYLRTAHLAPSVGKDAPLAELDSLQTPLTGPERMRTVALAYKLGEIAKILKKPEEEEKWLVWSVESILRLFNEPPEGTAALLDKDGSRRKILAEQLGLPPLFVRYNLAAPFEALGSFYARNGNPTYALPLYLQAISILIPPAPALSETEDRCRGAALMGNIAELIVRYQVKSGQGADAIMQAESWAKKGLDVATAARAASQKKCDVCEEAYAVLLYNLAMVRELAGDENRARQLLQESLEQSKSLGLDEGIKHASGALESLGTHITAEPAVKSLVADQDIIAAAASLE